MEKRLVVMHHEPGEEAVTLEVRAYLLEEGDVEKVMQELEGSGNPEPRYTTLAGSDLEATFTGLYGEIMGKISYLAEHGWTWEA